MEWIKSPHNPLLASTSENNMDGTLFGDPSAAYIGNDKEWRIVVGTEKNRTGLAVLYKSKYFVHWSEADHAVHSTEDTEIWECVDFYPVSTSSQNGLDTSVTFIAGSDIKHVPKSSMFVNFYDYYTIENYAAKKDIFIPDTYSMPDHSGLRYDYGKFYASKIFFDRSTNRRILWGWINESTDVATGIKK